MGKKISGDGFSEKLYSGGNWPNSHVNFFIFLIFFLSTTFANENLKKEISEGNFVAGLDFWEKVPRECETAGVI